MFMSFVSGRATSPSLFSNTSCSTMTSSYFVLFRSTNFVEYNKFIVTGQEHWKNVLGEEERSSVLRTGISSPLMCT